MTGKMYRVGKRFYDDHRYRDLPAGTVVAETKTTYTVELDAESYNELLSDADYYAQEMAGAGFDDRALCASARTLAKSLRKQGRPEGGTDGNH